MGDFNKTGFFSHLPITYGDEIVMFVCANTKCGERGSEIDSTPINVTGIGLTPIAMPFFGIYKYAVGGNLCQYCLSIGWLCWAVSIVLKDESDNVNIQPLEDE